MISVNFIVELPKSHGYNAIMCVVDSLTKRAHFIPMHTTINAEGTALLFLKEVWKHHGTPRVVVSDRGPQFVAAFTQELYKRLGIKLAMSMAYCKGITQTLIPDTLAVKPKASQSTDGNLLWSVVYISDTVCLRVGAADDTQPVLADPHPLRRPWPVTGRYAAGVP
jgi:hypothetical protein